MDAAANSNIKLVPFDANFGVDIVGFDIKHTSADEAGIIEQAVYDNTVVRIRGQEFDDEDHQRFTRNFGELAVPTLKQTAGRDQPGTPEFMTTVSNIIENGQELGQLGAGELAWHTDLDYKEKPHAWSLLHAMELPPTGGNTYFRNMYLAYETLPETTKTLIDGLNARHDRWTDLEGNLMGGAEMPAGYEERNWWETHDGVEHPLVRNHPATGRKALYFGRRHNLYVPGIPYGESEELIDRLWDHAINSDDFVWMQEWQLGDLIIWDNRCAMHRRDPFDPSARRLMRRTNTPGERPV